MEEWRTIEDAPNYEVSDKSRVRNKRSGRVLKENNQEAVGLYVNGERFCRSTWGLKKAAFPERNHG